MDGEKLIHMANQIGTFFAAMPDRDEAVDGVATHLKKFWEPRMRRKILAVLDTPEGASLEPLVAEALRRHRATLQPT
jgi:formate dehydrogenase subunit delta